MNPTSEIINPDDCIELMQDFWREQVSVAATGEGLALTLPLMYPDGWQVTVFLTVSAPGWLRISDHGKTLGTLVEAGMGLDAKGTRGMLDERLRTFELQRDGLVIYKDARLPVEAVDIQLFAEAIVSIAHLIFRHEPSTEPESVADQAVRRLFSARGLEPRRNVALTGKIESEIRVDYFLETRRSVGVEVIRRRGNIRDYMQQWAWRWTDLHAAHPQMVRAMVYDPTVQEITPTVRRIGESVCEVFCPYDEAEALAAVVG